MKSPAFLIVLRKTVENFSVFLISFMVVTLFSNQSYAQLPGYSFRKLVTIDNTKVSGSSDLTNFPILISITDTDLRTVCNLGNVSNDNGYDIGFTASDGITQLDHEIEKYDATTGEYIAWVNIPILDYNDDIDIYMYYGNSSLTTDQSSTATWNSNYSAVWHMSQDPSGSAPQITDATSATNDGTSGGTMTNTDLVDGKLGEALELDGINDYIDVGTLGAFGSSLSEATYQFWINTTSTTKFTPLGTINSGSNTAIIFELNSVVPFGSSSNGDTRFYIREQAGAEQLAGGTAITGFNNGGWHHITAVIKSASGVMEFYLDGTALLVSYSGGGTPDTFSDFQYSLTLGARNNRGTIGEFAPAIMDEVRISNIARSADWIATEFSNQDDPAAFCSFGAQEATVAPGNISANLKLWLKADAGICNPATVTNWNDQSSNGNNATQTGSSDFATYETNTHNFNPSVHFPNGDNGYFDVDLNAMKGSDYNVIGVVERDNSVSSNYFLGITGTATNERFHFGYRNNTTATTAHWGNDVDVTVNAFDSPGQSVALLRGELDQTVGKATYELREGSEASNTGTNKTALSGAGTGRLGHDHTGSRGFEGYVSEMIVYSSTLTSAELTKIYSYLAIKYGFTLTGNYEASDASPTPLWDAAANSTYHHDVTGIGRDDNSSLNQQKSMSANSDAMVLMDKGTTFASDLDFLLWGNNDASATSLATLPDVTYNTKLERTWKTAVTGTPGDVTVRIIYANTGTTTDYILAVDADGDFSAGHVNYPAASISGDTISFSGITFSDGDYFSLGVHQVGPGFIAGDLALWLKADEGTSTTADATALSSWVDQSADGNTVSQATGASQPLFKDNATDNINFNPVVDFDGIDDVLSDASGILGTATYSDLNVYSVVVTDVVQNSYLFREDCSPLRISAHAPWNDGTYYWDAGSSDATDRLSTAWGGSTGEPYLFSLLYSTNLGQTVSGANQVLIRNGNNIASDITADSFTGTNSQFNLASGNGSTYHDAKYAEFVVYAGAIDATQHNKIESYLAIKYGISLPGDYTATDGTTIWNTDVAYQNDITVIGRDDSQALYQKQSHSPDDSLKVFINTLAADNASNAGSISNDVSYLVIGHNGGGLEGQTTEMPAGIISRFEREWKVTNTNFNDDFSLEFEWKEYGTFDINDIRLLVDADGDFSNATILGPADGLTFSLGSIIVGGITTGTGNHIPLGTSYFTIASVSESTPLPIELIDFSATVVDGSKVELDWQTASETNNDFFTIERSVDGVSWTAILEVEGAGNSRVPLAYSALDEDPHHGISYYRLKQTDFDGQFEYSSARVVNNTYLESAQIKIYPNPSNSLITIEGNLSELEEIVVYNVFGQDVSASIRVTSRGNTSITMDISNLPDGLYTLKTKNNAQKIIKQ